MIRWISGIALGFIFLTYILLSSSLLYNLGLIIILSISLYELIKLRVLSLQYLLSYFFLGTAILCLYFYELERSLILVAVLISVITDAFAFFTGNAFGRKKAIVCSMAQINVQRHTRVNFKKDKTGE